jgi:hypothetical protein
MSNGKSGSSLTLTHDFEDVAIGPNYLTDDFILGSVAEIALHDLSFEPALPVVGGTAVVKWPDIFAQDGAEGHFYITAIDEVHHKINAFVLTYPNTSRQIRQPLITRDGNGAIVNQPALVVEAWDMQADQVAFRGRTP